jgi:predicted ATPase/DNA-binding CsgD family transcriptional regulator
MEAAINLPTPQTSFIGRADEIGEVVDLLTDPDCRLLTLIGPGGVGKTRLSIEVAHRVADHFPDGIYFVPLAALWATDDIVAAIIDATPFAPQQEPYEPRQELLKYLEEKRLLLAVDSFEHLLDCAPFLSEIVNRAPGVKLLVTSREALNLQEEWVRRVDGMELPNGNTRPEEASAVQLFLDRAGQVRRPDTLDLESVVQICRLVDGMPLAIELSAGWVNVLTPADIAREIRSDIDILTSTRRNIPERHRSMRAVFDHSLRLLDEDEREVFRRLTVFCGGFTREAADTVAGASFRTLALLVDKSLLHLNANGRYTIHELLRQYAQDKSRPALRDLHMQFFMELLRTAPLKSHDQMAALDRIEGDIENIRRAWEWAVETQAAGAIQAAMENLSLYCDMRTQYQLAIKLLRLAHDNLAVSPLLKSQIKAQILRMIMFGGIEHQLDLQAEINGCLAVAQEHDSPQDEAFCQYLLGMAALSNLKREPHCLFVQVAQEAVMPMREALGKFRELDTPFYEADALTWLGSGELSLGHIEEGLAFQQQGLAVRRELGDRHGAAWVLLTLGHTYYGGHQFEEAETYIRQALDIMREYRSIKGIVSSLITLGLITLSSGRFDETRVCAEEVLALSRSVNFLEGELSALGMLSILACLVEEDYETGMELAQQAKAIGERVFVAYIDPLVHAGLSFAACGLGDYEVMRQNNNRLFWKPYDDPVVGSVVLALEAVARYCEDDPDGAVELLAAAHQTPDRYRGWLDRWAYLGRVQAVLIERLGRRAYAEAWERGSALDLDATISQLAGPQPADVQSQANLALVEPLTERELEVLELVAVGMTNRDIADHLVLSVGTIKVHTRHIYQKLGVSSRTQATAKAVELGLI